MSPEIPIEKLRRLLRLDAQTGELFWLEREVEDAGGSNAKHLAYWNRRYAGRKAFAGTNRGGYLRGVIFDHTYSAHRVVWALAHGAWPIGPLDHINRDRKDNRPANLRVVSHRQNSQNRSVGKRNRSGHIGVAVTAKGRFQVTISNRYVGIFSTLDEAVSRRRAAEREHGYIGSVAVLR